MDDGTVQCWGAQLVSGIYPQSTDEHFIAAPRTIPNIEDESTIATGYNQTCWGGGSFNQISETNITRAFARRENA